MPDERFYFDINEELLKSNIVRLDGEVDESTSARVCAYLTALDNRNGEVEEEDGSVYYKPIWLYINSPGGSVIDGLAIIDTMKQLHSPVFTVCCGMAASMGAAILVHGDRRYITRNSRVMFHEVSSGTQGKVSEQRESLEEAERLNTLLEEMISERLGMSPKEYHKKILKKDLYLSADVAKKFGAVDVILKPEEKQINPRYLAEEGE